MSLAKKAFKRYSENDLIKGFISAYIDCASVDCCYASYELCVLYRGCNDAKDKKSDNVVCQHT